MEKVSLVWLRRDLRLEDHAALYHALKSKVPVLPLFIFDRNILDGLKEKEDARVTFIHRSVRQLKAKLEGRGSAMIVRYGRPEEVWEQLLEEWNIDAVYTNRDYETYALQRDERVRNLLKSRQIPWYSFKDQVIFEKEEVLKSDGDPYVVFTPYSRSWRERLNSRIEEGEHFFLKAYPCQQYASNLLKTRPMPMPDLEEMGFQVSSIDFPEKSVEDELLEHYHERRDYPAIQGTSRLGIHLRFGTISIRALARRALRHSDTFLNELIWRDFYAQILAHFPHVEKGPFRKKYESIAWRNQEDEFEAWCLGKTGYPMVDAGMRQLNATGYMHNRVRMITASFLAKHLLINWQWGEAYFAQKLLDFDLASNNGGWQWAAGCGTDAAPYFRIFNPESQQKKFDKDKKYIHSWIPEYGTADYPKPIVDHKAARERCLEVYKTALDQSD